MMTGELFLAAASIQELAVEELRNNKSEVDVLGIYICYSLSSIRPHMVLT